MTSKKYEVIAKLAEEHIVEDIVERIIKGSKQTADLKYANDLAQDIYISLLEMDDERITQLADRKQLRYYVIGIVNHNIFSNTSPFYYKYKKYNALIDEEIVETIAPEN